MAGERRHYCYECGEDMGPWTRFSDHRDTCGKLDCDRAARDALYAERDEAHEQLDRDMGFSW